MSLCVDAAAGAGGGQVEQIARTFGVDWPHLTAQIVSFAIVCAVLYWFAYQPVLRMLETRRQQIAQGLANTEKINAALANIESQRQGVMAEAQAQSAQAHRRGPRDRQAPAGTGDTAGGRGRRADPAQGARGRGQEHARMLAELRREVGRLVVQTTAAVVGKVLTPDDQRRLAEETRQTPATT